MGEMLKHGGLSRRSFLKGAALGLAGAGAVGAALPLAGCAGGGTDKMAATEIGRASCRERVCEVLGLSGGGGGG